MNAKLVTIWDTHSDAIAVMRQVRQVPVDPDNPEAGTVEEVLSSRILERVGDQPDDNAWVRRLWHGTPAQADPAGAGAANFAPGWAILVVIDVKPVPGIGQRLSESHDGGVPDLEAGTMTYTWSQQALDAADLSAAVAIAAMAKRDAINAERERRVYVAIGAIDVVGDGSLMVEPDIRDEADRANLVAIHTRAHQLATEGVTAAVIKFGAADNQEYDLTPVQALKLTSAPFDRATLLYQLARNLKDGALADAVAAVDLAAIAAIDPTDDAHWVPAG